MLNLFGVADLLLSRDWRVPGDSEGGSRQGARAEKDVNPTNIQPQLTIFVLHKRKGQPALLENVEEQGYNR